MLGLDEVRFQLVKAVGLLPSLPEQDRVNHFRRFRWDAVDGLLAACRGDAQELPAGDKFLEDLVSLLDATAVAPRRLVDALTAARDGVLRAAAVVPGEVGLRGIRFRRKDVERALWPDVVWMGKEQVAQRLGISLLAVTTWTRRGFLRPARWDCNRAKFDDAALRTFRVEFLVGGTDPRDPTARRNCGMTMHFKAIGVDPISGSSVDGCNITLFRRVDFTPDVLRRLTARARVGA